MFIPITFPIHQVLCSLSSFPMLLNFFDLIFLFFINNSGWRYWSYMLFFELQFPTSCQQVFIKNIMYLFWSSFFKGLFEWIFLLSSHILSPTFNPWGFLLFLSNCFFMAPCAISIDFIASSQLLCNPIRNSSSFGNSVCTIRLPFHGYLPQLSSNGVCPIAACFLSLYKNSVAANHSVQLSCW